MRLIKHLLAPPQFKDEKKTHQAYLLNIILLILIAVPIPFIAYLLIWRPGELYRTLIFIAFAEVINITLLAMVRRGFVRQAAVAHIITLWSVFAISSATRSGIYAAPYTLGNGLVITVAGILLGGRSARAITWIVIAQGGVMVYAEFQGWAPSYVSDDPIFTWAIAITLFAILVNLQILASNQLNTALTRAQTSEERYRSISEVISDYTFSTKVDPDGRIQLVWVAGAFEKITGYTFDEYVASGGWLAHLYPDDIGKDAQDTATLKANKPVTTEIRTYKKNGDVSWVRVYANPVWDERQTRLTGIVGAVQDITKQKEAEISIIRERDLLQTFMDNIPDQVYFKDTKSRFIRINNAQANFLNLNDPQDAIGKSDQDYQSPELARQFMEEEKRVMESGQSIVNRIEFNPTSEGTPRWIAATKAPVKDSSGNLLGTIGISRDITKQKLISERDEQRRQLLEKVITLGKQVAEVADLQTTLERIWRGIHDELGFDRVGIFFYDAEHNSMDRMLGTDVLGNMDATPASVQVNDWELFKILLERPDRFYFTHNYSLENKISKDHEMHGVKEYASIAVWADDKPVAAIAVDQLITQRPITENQLEALRLFAGYAGLAIENSRLRDALQKELTEQKQAEETEQRRRVMMEQVIRLGKQVTVASDLQTTLRKIWHGVRYDLDFDRTGLFLYNPQENSMDGAYGTDRSGQIWDARHVKIGLGGNPPHQDASVFLKVLDHPDGFYSTQDYESEFNLSPDHVMAGVKHYAVVAVWSGNKPVAVISVDQLVTGRAFPEEQLEALRLFAGYAGLAIENARLNDTIQDELNEKKRAEETEQQRRVMLEKVIQLGKQVTEVSDLKTTLEKIWYALHEGLDFDRIGIFAYQPETNSISRMLGTDTHGNRDDTAGEPVPISNWHAFQYALEKPDGYYFTHNFSQEATIPEDNEMYTVSDYATAAAWAGGKLIAIIAVDQLVTQRPITEQQLDALRLFAGYAGLAIENSRLNDAIQNELNEKKRAEEIEQRRRLALEKVIQLGKQVTEVSNLRTTLKKIWNGVRHDLDFDRVGLFTYDSQENVMIGAYGTNREGKIWDAWHVRFELDENALFYKVLSRPDGYFFTRDFEKELNLPPDHDMAGVKYCAMVAVWAGNKPVAIISVDQLTTGRPILEEQLESLRLFAGYAGLAISNANLNDVLEDELAQRQTFINELETKNAELERFTYTVSHDLKSPLVTITGFLGYLEKDALTGNKDRIRSSVNRISSAAEKMQELLNDLLELSRIGRLMNPPETIPFEEVVNEAVDHVQGRLDERNALLKIQKDLPTIYGDRARLVEVMQNLIDNAAKYSNPNIQPIIEVGAILEQQGKTIYFVRDNGIGIEPQFHERIFGLFNKLNPHSEGTGIGLSLIKRIIEVHNGQIWVESEAGRGSTFYFTLPKA